MTQPAARQPIPVGKFFLDRGKITPKQLDLALKHRAEFGLKLGQSLVELGFVTETDMVEALRYQARFPCIHLTNGIVEPRVAAKVGEGLSRRLKALALNQVAGHTTVALEDPSDAQAIEELQHVLATRIFPVYAEPSTIAKLIDQVFGPGKSARAKTPPAAHPPAPALPVHPASPPTARGAEPPPSSAALPTMASTAFSPAASAAIGDPDDERAVVSEVRGFLQQAFECAASDIHLEARREELLVRFRVDGVLREHRRLPASWTRPAIACVKALAKLEGEEAEGARTGLISFLFRKQPVQVGLELVPALHGESAVLSVRPGERPRLGLDALGLGPLRSELDPLLTFTDGLLLVGGPPGSGRTTTLHALFAHLVKADKKAVALDREVIPTLDGALFVRVDARAGRGFASGAHALLKQDPDLLMVGEIDGPEAAHAVLEAALSGRHVLSSLRSSDALGVLARLGRLGLEPYLVAEALRGVVAQRLVRRVCAECRTPSVPDEALRARLGLAKDKAIYHEGQGCEACFGTGYHGRVRLFEVLGMTSGLRRELEKGAGPETLARVAREEGFQGFLAHGLELARSGVTTLHEVLAATSGV